MVSEREIGIILTEIKHLTEKLGAHAEQTQRLFTETSIENSRRFDKVDEQIKSSADDIKVLNDSIQQQKVINRVGTWGAITFLSALGLFILWMLGLIPALFHWLAGDNFTPKH